MFNQKLRTAICLLVACTGLAATNIKAQTLSEADRLYGLSQVWSEAKYNFVYFDKVKLDWDSLYRAAIPQVLQAKNTQSYYDVLRRFAAYLNDGHTSVWYPGSYYQQQHAYAPLKTDLVQGKVFVTRLLNDTLQQQGLEPGVEILKVNGEEVHAYAEKHIRPFEGASTPQQMDFYMYNAYLLNGPVDEPLKLTIRNKKGTVSEATVSRRLVKKEAAVIRFSVLPNNIGLLQINGFTAADFNKQFDQLYPELLQTRALIIDLRENAGGNGSQGTYMLKHFLKIPFPDPVITSRQYNPLQKVWGMGSSGFYSLGSDMNKPFTDRNIYEKPIAVLIGRQTASAAEDFAMPFDYMQRGMLIGQPTTGSTGQPMMSELPGGGTLRICVRKDTYPNGKEYVGVGIQPHIPVAENAEAFRKGEDLVMKKALELLK